MLIPGFGSQGVSMLKINCVLVNGRLVGKSISDRWNLETIGYGMGANGKPISVTNARRLAHAVDCQIMVHRADQTIKAHASKMEVSALGRKLSKLLAWVA